MLDETGQELAEIGAFSVIKIDVESALTDGVSIHSIFDIEQTTWNYYEELYKSAWQLKSKVERIIEPPGLIGSLNILIIDRLIVHP